MYCINKLKDFIPPLLLYKKNFYLAKAEKVSLPNEKKIFIFLAANYGNLGDIAITYAQHKWLEERDSEYVVVEVPSNCSYSYLKGIMSKVQNTDIITFVGGGNMGDMYPLYENIRQLIVSICPHNRILQFPLTTDFSSTRQGRLMQKYAKKIYGNHENITILAREDKSEKFLSKLFGKKINIAPDIVMTLDCLDFATTNRNGVAVCMRQDKEKAMTEADVSSIQEVLKEIFSQIDYTDTVIDDISVTLTNKEKHLEAFLRNLAKKQLLITDRLHGMIFAYITGTPAIAFSNSNQKVKFCYEWIKDCGYIFLWINMMPTFLQKM